MDLYQLKREFGRSITINRRTNTTAALETGLYSNSYDSIAVVAVPLPARLITTDGEQKAPFAYGGVYDHRRRSFLIEESDLQGQTILPREWIVDKGKRYEIESIEDSEFGLLIIAKQETEVDFIEIVPITLNSFIHFTLEVDDG